MTTIGSPESVPQGFERTLFINCPFDAEYLELLRPLLFTVIYAGFSPVLASKRSDSGENRLRKICEMIWSARYSIHDLSRLKAEEVGEFYRMNMPFELGIDYGTRQHGPEFMRRKRFLVVESERHDYVKAISDLAGVDIKTHGDEAIELVRCARDWLYETAGVQSLDYFRVIWNEFNEFLSSLYEERLSDSLSETVSRDDVAADVDRMPVSELIDSALAWIDSREKAI